MAAIQFPSTPTEGQVLTAANGRKLKYTGGVWTAVHQFTGGGGVDSGLSEQEVTTIAQTVTSNAIAAIPPVISESAVTTIAQGVTTSAITALGLGNLATAQMIVSTAAPDNAIGKNGDIWMQTV